MYDDDDAFWSSDAVAFAVDQASAQALGRIAGPSGTAQSYTAPKQPVQQQVNRGIAQQAPRAPPQTATTAQRSFTQAPTSTYGQPWPPPQPVNQNYNPNGSGSSRSISAPKASVPGPPPAAPSAVRPGSASKNAGAPTITFRLDVSPDVQLRVSVECEPIPAVINTIRALPNPSPVVKSGRKLTWTFAMSDYAAVVQGLARAPAVVAKVEGALPPWLVAALSELRPREPLIEQDPLAAGNIPRALVDRLLPFQKDGIRFAIRKQGRVLIGDEMGLGKTVQALAVALHYRREWPLLVVAPASLKFVWAEAFEAWETGVAPAAVMALESQRPDRLDLSRVQVLILTYDQARVHAHFLIQQKYKVVILDEAHAIKNFEAKRTQAVQPIVQAAARAILLTGTPLVSRPRELHPLLAALHPRLFKNFHDFGNRYCDPKQVPRRGGGGMLTSYDGASNLGELHVLANTVMIRRLKADVLKDLPAKRRQKVPIACEAGLQRRIKEAMQQNRKALDACDAGKAGAPSPASSPLLVQLYCDTGTAKAAAVGEYVENLLEGAEEDGLKFLVFYHHVNVGDELEGVLKGPKHKMVRGRHYIRISGQTPPSERMQLVETFQTSRECRVAVLSITAAGTGLTLTAASTAIFAELSWTPADVLQAEDRIHRMGQESSSVEIRYLVAPGTADDIMWRMLDKKIGITSRALNGREQGLEASTARVKEPPNGAGGDIRGHFAPAPAPLPAAAASSAGSAAVAELMADLPPGAFDDFDDPGYHNFQAGEVLHAGDAHGPPPKRARC